MRVVLEAPIGGLGDGLLFSTLPELYAEQGHEVYYSSNTVCRNPEVFDLLYKRNPYFRGCSDEGDLRVGIPCEREFFFKARLSDNPISLIEKLHGFDGFNEVPKIYYTPNILPEWQTRIFVDPHSISQGFPWEAFDRFVRHTGYGWANAMFVAESSFCNSSGVDYFAPRGYLPYVVRDIYEYIDIIASCYVFLCTESGSQSLAAAVRKGRTFALCTTQHLNTRLYVWPNVIYTAIRLASDDYLWNDLTGERVGER